MKLLRGLLIGLLTAGALGGRVRAAATTTVEEAFLQAWEATQKSDPKTAVFEKKAPGRYHFKTTRFPFDGELKVLNVTVNEGFGDDADLPAVGKYGFAEVELVGWSKDDLMRYAQSYALWTQTHTLYHDAKGNRWLPTVEYFKSVRNAAVPVRRSLWASLSTYLNYLWILLLVYFVGVLFVSGKRVRRNFKQIEESIQLSRRSVALQEESVPKQRALLEETNRLLTEILANLKKGPPAP